MAVRHFSNPVSLSKEIMKKSVHCALSGDGAKKFAEAKRFPVVEPGHLMLDEAKEWERTTIFWEEENYGCDSVTAVALDQNGHFACAMSTGILSYI